LRAPLAVKLVGANAAVFIAFAAVWRMESSAARTNLLVTLGVIAGVLGVHALLVLVALRPIRDIEAAVSRVWYGDFGARVARSRIADREVLRVGAMFNILLDDVASDRARLRALATEVIEAGDRERGQIAHELQNSTAQNIAALLFQLSAAARDTSDPELADRLRDARDSAEASLEEVRLLSSTVHAGVLDDLGLEAALRKLARESSHGTGIDVDVHVKQRPERLPHNLEIILYRVAREAVRNATLHASPRRVRVTLYREAGSATLEVHDDGRGFDLAEIEREQALSGLRSMRERLALVDGWLEIKTAPGNGTTVSATVPLEPAADALHLETV
jgi:signal transduction histidine kinase